MVKQIIVRRSGFTLIELLTVTAIIGLVVSILLAVVGQTREAGNRTVCLSNLRAIGQGLLMYSQSNHDYLPNDNPPTVWNTWQSGDFAPVAMANTYIRNPKVFLCPSDKNASPKAITNAEVGPSVTNSARTSYEFYSLWWPPEKGPLLPRLHGQAPLAWDMDGGDPSTSQYRNHSARAGNVVFADGHGEWQLAKAWDASNEPHPFLEFYP